jgi:hypothetical protein
MEGCCWKVAGCKQQSLVKYHLETTLFEGQPRVKMEEEFHMVSEQLMKFPSLLTYRWKSV